MCNQYYKTSYVPIIVQNAMCANNSTKRHMHQHDYKTARSCLISAQVSPGYGVAAQRPGYSVAVQSPGYGVAAQSPGYSVAA